MHNGIIDVSEVIEMDEKPMMFYCQTHEGERALFSVKETATRLGICESLVRRLISQGEIKGVRLGDRILVPRQEVERIAGQGVEAA